MVDRTPRTPLDHAKQLAFNLRVCDAIRSDLIDSLKPTLRQWMAIVNAPNSGVLGLTETEMKHLGLPFEHSLIDLELLIEVAKALVKDGEWIENDHSDHHHAWASNPDYAESHAS